MPITDAAPLAAIVKQLPADWQLPSELLERVRTYRVLDGLKKQCGCTPEGKYPDASVILVCAQKADDQVVGVWLPDPPSLMEDMGRALHTRIGPVEIGSDHGGLGLKVRF